MLAMRSCAGPPQASGSRIFSSGSVLAQKLLFANSTSGDLSRFLSAYFDTGVGAKGEAGSYRRIAEAVEVTPSRVLFISDVSEELDAARESGMQTLALRAPAGADPAVEHCTGSSKTSAASPRIRDCARRLLSSIMRAQLRIPEERR